MGLIRLQAGTAELDGRAVRQLSSLLRGLSVAKLVASRDLRLIRDVTSRSVVLAGGRIVADGKTDSIFADESLIGCAGLA